jgi:hypothetical protein
MTNQHRLTDVICEQIRESIKLPRDEQGHILSYDGQRILDGMFEELFEISNAELRTAADWQLEQVMKWIEEELPNYGKKFEGSIYLDVDFIYKKFKEAMCRANTQEDNS